MTHVVVIRHGRTELNRLDRFRGRSDVDLDELGMRQAAAMAERVAEFQISEVYSSPLRRAMTTASFIARRLGSEVKPLEGVMDIDYGQWQGLSLSEARADDCALYDLWLKSPQLVKFPHGESLAEVRERAATSVENLMALHHKKTIAVVSHKVVCQVLATYFLGLDNSHFWQVSQDVCAVNLYERRSGLTSALLLNDTCHLKELAKTT